LQWGASANPEEVTDGITSSERPRLDITMKSSCSIVLAFDWPNLGALLAEGGCNLSDFSLHAYGDYDSFGSAFGDSGRTEGDVKPVTGPNVTIEGSMGCFCNWKRFSSQESFVCFKIDRLNQPQVSGH
jgi:hypothetical protein